MKEEARERQVNRTSPGSKSKINNNILSLPTYDKNIMQISLVPYLQKYFYICIGGRASSTTTTYYEPSSL